MVSQNMTLCSTWTCCKWCRVCGRCLPKKPQFHFCYLGAVRLCVLILYQGSPPFLPGQSEREKVERAMQQQCSLILKGGRRKKGSEEVSQGECCDRREQIRERRRVQRRLRGLAKSTPPKAPVGFLRCSIPIYWSHYVGLNLKISVSGSPATIYLSQVMTRFWVLTHLLKALSLKVELAFRSMRANALRWLTNTWPLMHFTF